MLAIVYFSEFFHSLVVFDMICTLSRSMNRRWMKNAKLLFASHNYIVLKVIWKYFPEVIIAVDICD